jgi:hypothetical protein
MSSNRMLQNAIHAFFNVACEKRGFRRAVRGPLWQAIERVFSTTFQVRCFPAFAGALTPPFPPERRIFAARAMHLRGKLFV